MAKPVDRLSHERLVELFLSRQQVRHAYVSMAELRDSGQSTPALIACTRLLYTALTVLDNSLDDLEANEHTARGAVKRANEALAEVKRIRAEVIA